VIRADQSSLLGLARHTAAAALGIVSIRVIRLIDCYSLSVV